jgi:hypothetical protein
MSFREVDGVQDATVDSQLRALKKTLSSSGLPAGFQWLVVDQFDGTRSLSIVETDTNRVVIEGF